MNVEFSIDEVLVMAEAVLDGVGELKLDRKDKTALRRWRNKTVTATSTEMKLLTDKVNRDLQRASRTSRKTEILKPDWA
jgi:hypothetical protein